MAHDFFPLTKEAAQAKGYRWRTEEAREYRTTMDAANLPDHIREAEDTLLDEIIRCAACGRAYRLIQMELEFLRTASLPLPRRCPDCRYLERAKYRNSPRFFHRQCACGGAASDNGAYKNQADHFHGSARCPGEFETTFAPERPEIVYCEQCYQAEVA